MVIDDFVDCFPLPKDIAKNSLNTKIVPDSKYQRHARPHYKTQKAESTKIPYKSADNKYQVVLLPYRRKK